MLVLVVAGLTRAFANRLGSCCDFGGHSGHNNYQVDCGGGIERGLFAACGGSYARGEAAGEAAGEEAHPTSQLASITVEKALLTPKMEPHHDRYGNA